jgi:hypothetical protein
MDFVTEYVIELRERAKHPLFGDSPEAKIAARIADELESKRIAHLSEELPMSEAVKESGYSAVQLGRLRNEGKWSGRRADLPRRPGLVRLAAVGAATLAERVIARRAGGRH